MSKTGDCDVAIIGAGASGLAAALTIKRENPKISVIISEKKDRAAKKLAAAGNGRCNLSNEACSEDREVFEFFARSGILLRKDSEGRMYPCSEDGGQIASMLAEEAVSAGACIMLSSEVKKVEARPEGGFLLLLEEKGQNRELCADKVLIATGGKSYPAMGTTGDGYVMARKLGHRVISPAPGLTAICTAIPEIKGLKGLRAKAEVKLCLDGREIGTEIGEIQFRDDSLSGICIMNLSNRVKPRGENREGGESVESRESKVAGESREMGKIEKKSFAGYELLCDFAHGFEKESLRDCIKGLCTSRLSGANDLAGARNTRDIKEAWTGGGIWETMDVCRAQGGIVKYPLAEVIAARAGIEKGKKLSQLTEAEMGNLVENIKNFRIPVTGLKGWKEAQVTCGGVSMEEIDESTMESKILPGLYFSGEVTDYAGPCGGFNLHNAWRTGIIAGKGIAAKFTRTDF